MRPSDTVLLGYRELVCCENWESVPDVGSEMGGRVRQISVAVAE